MQLILISASKDAIETTQHLFVQESMSVYLDRRPVPTAWRQGNDALEAKI